MFGGLTHEPAIELTKKLLDKIVKDKKLSKVFLCDSGSVSVEVAMKMAYQYWYRVLGEKNNKKTKLLSLRNGYHGDTFGAMSVCDPVNGMHNIFDNILQKHFFVSSPSSSSSEYDYEKENKTLNEIKDTLNGHNEEIAAIIFEPIVQGNFFFDFLF